MRYQRRNQGYINSRFHIKPIELMFLTDIVKRDDLVLSDDMPKAVFGR